MEKWIILKLAGIIDVTWWMLFLIEWWPLMIVFIIVIIALGIEGINFIRNKIMKRGE